MKESGKDGAAKFQSAINDYRTHANKCRAWAQNAVDMKQEDYEPEPFGDPNRFATPATSGVPYYCNGLELPEAIVERAKELIQFYHDYFDKCFCEANPEVSNEVSSSWEFNNALVARRSDVYITEDGKKFTMQEVLARARTREYETRETYTSSLIEPLAELFDDIATFIESGVSEE